MRASDWFCRSRLAEVRLKCEEHFVFDHRLCRKRDDVRRRRLMGCAHRETHTISISRPSSRPTARVTRGHFATRELQTLCFVLQTCCTCTCARRRSRRASIFVSVHDYDRVILLQAGRVYVFVRRHVCLAQHMHGPCSSTHFIANTLHRRACTETTRDAFHLRVITRHKISACKTKHVVCRSRVAKSRCPQWLRSRRRSFTKAGLQTDACRH